jgi:protein O-mannosyl-transferase
MPGTEVLAIPPVSPRATAKPWALRGVLEGNPFYVFLLGVVTYALYAPSFGFPFVYDDVFQIVQNDHLDSWRFLPVYFTRHAWSHVPGVPANFYRPFFLLWMRLNNLAFGHEPAAWHLTTILLHLAAAILVYRLAVELLQARGPALLAALIFAVHPVQVESVAWVSGATEPLAAIFFLGSFLLYLRSKREPSQVWTAASLAMFAAALLVKETATVLPGAIVAYELTLGCDQERSKLWPKILRALGRVIPYACVLAAYLAVRTLVLHSFAHSATTVPLGTSLLTWPWLLCSYLRLLVWPAGLSPLYDLNYVTRFTELRWIVPVLGLLAIAAAIVWTARKEHSPRILFLAAWFLLTLAPAMAIFCEALPAEGFHGRYLYLPSIAFGLAVAAAFGTWFERTHQGGQALAVATSVVFVAILAGVARHQLPYWASDYALFARACSIAPKNESAGLNLAAELVRHQDYRQALMVSQRTVRFNPQSARALGSAASCAFYLADYQLAEAYYARAVALDPSRANLQYYLGLSRLRLGSYAAARAALQAALQDNPQQGGVHYALGLVWAHSHQWPAARDEFLTELTNDPGNVAVKNALADAEGHIGPAH